METPSKFSLAIKWGGIMAVLLVIVSLVFYLTGMIDLETGKSGWGGQILNWVITIGCIVMAIREYRDANHNNLSTGDGAVLGLLTGLISGVLVAIYTYIFMSMIAPEILDGIREQAMANVGDMDADQEEQVSGMMNTFLSPGFMSVMVVLVNVFFGLIIGFVAGLIMKNENPINPFEGEEA